MTLQDQLREEEAAHEKDLNKRLEISGALTTCDAEYRGVTARLGELSKESLAMTDKKQLAVSRVAELEDTVRLNTDRMEEMQSTIAQQQVACCAWVTLICCDYVSTVRSWRIRRGWGGRLKALSISRHVHGAVHPRVRGGL